MAKLKKNPKLDLAGKEKTELIDMISQLKKEIVKQRLDLAAGRLRNVSLLIQQKKQLARVKTFLRVKELNENTGR